MNKWISIDERLPEKSGEYLTIDTTGIVPRYLVTYYSAKYKVFQLGSEMITHWMFLPEPPNTTNE